MTIYAQQKRPICKICNKKKVISSGKTKQGFTKWSYRCHSCKNHPHRKHKKQICEECGFIPQIPQQLDVDHIDGNHSNNDPSNLKTLCANCHRLKTFLNEEYIKRIKKGGH